jgi:hypothetical protein
VNCRFRAKRAPLFVVPPGASEAIPCTVEVLRPGPFEDQMHLYYEDRGLREIVLKIRGEAGQSAQASAN